MLRCCEYLILSTLLLMFSVVVSANEQSGPSSVALDTHLVQPVDARIISLVLQDEASHEIISASLSKIEKSRDDFNEAEHALIFYLTGIIAFKQNDYQGAVQWLVKAKELTQTLTLQQRQSKPFIPLLLRLAQSYVKLENYQQAYIERKEYRRRLYEFNLANNGERIAALDKIYDTQRKAAENELLLQENKVKAFELEEANRNKISQQFNTFILIAVVVVFLILLIRQLTLRKRLTDLSRTDSLTKLLNRRSLFYYGEKLFHEATISKTPFSIILIDIDKFKLVNDLHGHDIGDEVLKVIARLGQETVRARDKFARLGGEEFLAVLPGAAIGECKAIAERLREKIFTTHFEHLGIDTQVTISLGVASLNENITTFDQLVNLADSAMYQAKNTGRNRICESQLG